MKDTIKAECNDKEIMDNFLSLSKRIKNLKPIMRSITRIMLTDIDENFETEGKNADRQWAQWSKSWRKERQRRGHGDGKILTMEGDLRRSFSREITDNSALVGTNKEYAAIHNFGGDIKKKNGGTFTMEQREFAVWSDNLKAKVLTELIYELHIQDYLDGEAARLKFLKGE